MAPPDGKKNKELCFFFLERIFFGKNYSRGLAKCDGSCASCVRQIAGWVRAALSLPGPDPAAVLNVESERVSSQSGCQIRAGVSSERVSSQSG